MSYRYNIDVEHEGGADLGFVWFCDEELVAGEPVRDVARDRSYVILRVAEATMPDPLDPDLILGSAVARPTE